MADETATTEATETTAAETGTASTTEPATGTLGDAGKKALDAERKERRAAEKRASELEAQIQQFQDRDKSEAQRLTERVEAAENRARELETHSMRLEIAAEKGLTPTQAKRLSGTTREELEADAAELLEMFKPAKTDDDTEAVVASLDLGTRGTATSTAGDPAADFAKFLKRELA